MKNENLIYLTAFLLSLSLILLLEAGSLRLLAEDIKPVERKEVEIELLLSASNNPAAENTQAGNNEKIIESENEQEENDFKEKETKNEEADKSSLNEEKELEKNDQFVEEEEKREEKEVDEVAVEEIKTEKIQQEKDLKTEKTEEIAEKTEEPKKEVQEAENKEKQDKIKPAEQENTPSENKVVEEKQDTMPAWLDNSKSEVEKDNSKKAEAKTEEENEDRFDLDSYLAELANDDSADQENEVNKEVNKNNENKSDNNLRENESEISEENRENKAEDKTDNQTDTAPETAQNDKENKVYDLREGSSDSIQKPGIKNYSQPSYPSNLRKRNIEGKVIISLRIDKEGKAHDLKINHSSGYDSFDQAALNAVSSWEFKAAEKDGKKIYTIFNSWDRDQKISFEIDDRKDKMKELLSGKEINMENDKITININGLSGMILK